jgi:hypothetical protein
VAQYGYRAFQQRGGFSTGYRLPGSASALASAEILTHDQLGGSVLPFFGSFPSHVGMHRSPAFAHFGSSSSRVVYQAFNMLLFALKAWCIAVAVIRDNAAFSASLLVYLIQLASAFVVASFCCCFI